ncbi:MAG TPA: hypothetical protein VNO14_11015, partial [Blastocatellia bacterium]|nr:hypothetical protein [Blastocatellia bacterium]
MRLSEEDIKQLMRGQTARSGARQSECLTEDQFLRALTADASADERARAAAHMAACSDCAEEYHILRSLRSVIEEAEPAAPVVTAHAPQGGWRQAILSALSPARAAFALAASLLIIMSLLAWLVITRQDSNRQIAALNERLAEQYRALESTRESLGEMSRKLEETTNLPPQ